MLPKPEEVPKKTKSRGENLAKTCGGTKKTKKSFGGLGLGGLKKFSVFLVPPQVLTMFCLKTLPEPEEVPKKKSRGENLAKT